MFQKSKQNTGYTTYNETSYINLHRNLYVNRYNWYFRNLGKGHLPSFRLKFPIQKCIESLM